MNAHARPGSWAARLRRDPVAKLLHWVGIPVLLIWALIQPGLPNAVCEQDEVNAEAMHVLFVGNSYTSFNSLPRVVEEIAAANSVAMSVSYVMADAALLADHWLETHARQCIRARHFDAVVLQGNSLGTLHAIEQFEYYGRQFAELNKTTGAETVWYATWPRQALHPIYSDWRGGSPERMNQQVEGAYQRAAQFSGGTVAPVGSAWLRSMRDTPELALYEPDGSHPMPAGTLLAAFVIYEAITGTQSRTLTDPPLGIRQSEAEALRTSANATSDQ